MTAAFSRSASATFAMTRFISSGKAISFNSTFSTWMPQGSVASSMIEQICCEIFSRSPKSPSSVTAPTAFRIVVCAS